MIDHQLRTRLRSGLDEPLTAPLARVAEAFADKPAIDFLGRVTSWADLVDQIDRLARGLAAIGVKKGDRVGLLLPNTPYYVISFYAVTRLGAIVVNFNPLYAEEEILHQVEDSGVSLMITLDLKLMLPKVLKAVEVTDLAKIVVCPLGDAMPTSIGMMYSLFKRTERFSPPAQAPCITFGRLLDIGRDAALPEVIIDPKSDLAVLQYTGGTTGRPKGAMLTHDNLVTNAAQVAYWCDDLVPGEERMLGVLPLFHVFAMTVVMNMSVQLGATMVLLPRFNLQQVLNTIARKKPTIFPGVPTLFNAIVQHPKVARFDLTSLRFCISGGAPLPVEVKSAFEAQTGCVMVEGYGLSEASPVVTCNPTSGENKAGSIGLPLDGSRLSFRDLEDPTREVVEGELGEICVRGPQVMPGYWRRPEATQDCFVDGWLRTGDVGYLDEDGYTFLVDRIKDLIIVNGYNVYPRTIEDAIYAHEEVAEVTVIGVDCPDRGQVPKAFVRLKKEGALDEAGLLAFLKPKLSPMEIPRQIEFRDELPKTMIGKLSKKELVAEERSRDPAIEPATVETVA